MPKRPPTLNDRYRFIGRRLHEAREEAGMTQPELAVQLGCDAATISGWERAHRRISVEDLIHAAQVFHRRVGWFTGEDVDLYDVEELIEADRDLMVAKRQTLKEMYRVFRERGRKRG